MKIDLLRVVLLAVALAAAGCTNKETEDPDDSALPAANEAPVADAGPGQTVGAGEQVTLAGSGTDRDGTIAGYSWSQASGPSVTLTADAQGGASFTAPQTEELLQLVFELRVTDNSGATSPADPVTVTVLPAQQKFFGTATDSAEDYNQLLTYFSQITPGNAGKWGSVESTRNVMTWENLDTAYNFAQSHELRFKHHTLIWGQQQPGWLEGLPAEEQLAEIDEWMAAVAAKYEDLDMIDVVNEPLHAPPSYKEALGGDGATGWDWLIKAFEMARVHFPDSILILNDYNILNLKESTEAYRELVEQLQDRGLIDAIGVQGHFLEQTRAEDVKANLDLLAATGLPIYVSELDINFFDDARQANVMRDLFSVLWEHPAVAGVTHWGYLRGRVWRPNAWLLGSDGGERPALQWLNCYLADTGDCDHLVPEYVPAGWAGTDEVISLEAELYDQGQGVQAAGDSVAQTDAGDWILFQGVEFRDSWDSFSVHYAKGQGATGSISLRLDSLNSPNALRVELPPTGGWGEYQTATAEWPALAGTHDLYVRFNDVTGVGNIDWLRFGVAGAEPELNLVTNGDFEQGTEGWGAGWAGGTIESSASFAHQGQRSLRVSGFGGGAYALHNLTSAVVAGTSYPVSAWVLHTGTDAAQITLTRKLACAGQSDSYSWLANDESIAPETWTQLQGLLEIPVGCEPTEVLIYFENTAAGNDVYIDEVKVIAPASGEEPDDNLVTDGGFESVALSSNWSAWYASGTLLELTGEQVQAGAQSLRVSNRSENSNPSYNLTSSVSAGASYDVSVWVRHTGPDAEPVTLTRKLACEGQDDSYSAVAENSAVAANEWTQLTGTLEIPAGCTVSEARLYFENTPLSVETLYIDEISVISL